MAGPVNGHLFRGEIRSYWRLLARGADKSAVVQHRHTDRRFDFGLDRHGLAKRNGGIVQPTDRALDAGRWLYRFVGTQAYSRYGASAMLGHWWLDEDNWRLLRDAARAERMPMEVVARNYLALPDEWGDRGRTARGRLAAPVMAWTGVGNVAVGNQGSHTPTQHNKAIQLFLPGDTALIGRAFGDADHVECIYTRELDQAGW